MKKIFIFISFLFFIIPFSVFATTSQLSIIINSSHGSVLVSNLTTSTPITTFPATIDQGDNIELVSTPEYGFQFYRYKIEGGPQTVYHYDNTFFGTMSYWDMTITVEFEVDPHINEFTLLFTATHGTASAYNVTEDLSLTSPWPVDILSGDFLELEATPESGYIFYRWKIESGYPTVYSYDNPLFNAMISSNVTVTAEFIEIPDYRLYFTTTPLMGVSTVMNNTTSTLLGPFNPYVDVAVGDSLTFTATPESGYSFSHWDINPHNAPPYFIPSSSHTMDMPSSDVTVEPIYVDDSLDVSELCITYNSSLASVDIFNITTSTPLMGLCHDINIGHYIELSVFDIPPGFEFYRWKIEGGPQTVYSYDNPWYAGMPSSYNLNLTLEIVETPTYILDINFNMGNVDIFNITTSTPIEPPFPTGVVSGEHLSFTATPPPGGNIFVHWKIEGEGYPTQYFTENPFYHSMPNFNATVTPVFDTAQSSIFPLTINWDGDEGSVTAYNVTESTPIEPPFPVMIEYGDNISMNIIPESGYSFSHWNIQAHGYPTYTTTENPFVSNMFPSSVVVHAILIPEPVHNITPIYDSSRGNVDIFNITTSTPIEPPFPNGVTNNHELQVTATPESGYSFSHWNIQAHGYPDVVSYTNPLINYIPSDTLITAHFVQGFELDLTYNENISTVIVTNLDTGLEIIGPFPVEVGEGINIMVEIEMHPDVDYLFSGWHFEAYGYPSFYRYSPQYISVMPSTDTHIFATYTDFMGVPPPTATPPPSPILTNFINVMDSMGFDDPLGYSIFISLILIIINLIILLHGIHGFPLIIINGSLISLFAFSTLIPPWISLTILIILGMIFISLKGVMSSD